MHAKTFTDKFVFLITLSRNIFYAHLVYTVWSTKKICKYMEILVQIIIHNINHRVNPYNILYCNIIFIINPKLYSTYTYKLYNNYIVLLYYIITTLIWKLSKKCYKLLYCYTSRKMMSIYCIIHLYLGKIIIFLKFLIN